MNISGSGHIASGEYNDSISISGSGKIDGNIRCISLTCSGSVTGAGDIICSENAKISGSAHLQKCLSARNIRVSGSLSVDGNCTSEAEIKISGGFKCGSNLKCSLLKASGGINIGGGIESEEVCITGGIKCGGLLNAEKISIEFEHSSNFINSIGGSNISIFSKGNRLTKRLPLLTKLIGNDGFIVRESIEGEIIALENVSAPLVVGRIVAIGSGCEIDMVQYSEEIEIHPDAKVARYEKI